MFIDPPEGCEGQPVNLDNIATYGEREHYTRNGWTITFLVSGCGSLVEWPFSTKAAALEGIAYIKELRDSPLMQVSYEG